MKKKGEKEQRGRKGKKKENQATGIREGRLKIRREGKSTGKKEREIRYVIWVKGEGVKEGEDGGRGDMNNEGEEGAMIWMTKGKKGRER